MKKVLLAAVAVLGFTFANAQETKFGAKAGLNISNFTGDVEDNSSKVGFQVGVFAEIKVSDKFAVQPELAFSALGAKFDAGTDVNYNMNYIVVPVMAKYFATEKLSLEVGPQVGFLMSAKAKADSDSVDVKDFFNSTDFGLNLGAGYDVAENINIGLRYSLGLSNIAKDSGDQKVGNSNIALALGYKF